MTREEFIKWHHFTVDNQVNKAESGDIYDRIKEYIAEGRIPSGWVKDDDEMEPEAYSLNGIILERNPLFVEPVYGVGSLNINQTSCVMFGAVPIRQIPVKPIVIEGVVNKHGATGNPILPLDLNECLRLVGKNVRVTVEILEGE